MFQFAIVEVVVTSIQDGFPKWVKKHLLCHEMLVLLVCIVSFLFGLPNITQVNLAKLSEKFEWERKKNLISNSTLIFPGWHLLLPADRSLRRLDIHNVPGVLRSHRHLVVLRRASIVQQRKGDDWPRTVDIFSLLLARSVSSPDNGMRIMSHRETRR